MKDVINYLNSLLEERDTVVVATSGGPDSMCLLNLLCELKKSLHLNIVVAHVNHKLRRESDDEALFVSKFAKENGIIYEYMEITEYNHDNLENDARLKRYSFFNTLIKKYHAKYLMTAHHGDDLMETILMRLTRGSSIKGYSGFHKIVAMDGYQIIRPLITKTKQEIEDFMNDNNLKYVIDKSNFSNTYTRNRYRKIVLPFLKNENKNVHRKFLKFSEELNAANEFLDRYIKDLIDHISDDDGIKINEALKLDNFLLKKVIEYTLGAIYTDDLFLITDKHTDLIMKLLKSKKSNMSIHLPNNYIALKSYNSYKIIKEIEKSEYYYVLQDKVLLPNKMIIRKIEKSNAKNNFILRLNSRDIKLPIIIRTRKNGDKMEIKNLGGSKKIKDIFIDEKIKKDIRNNIPIVTDSQNNILWLPGIKKSKFDVERDGIYDIILSYEEEN